MRVRPRRPAPVSLVLALVCAVVASHLAMSTAIAIGNPGTGAHTQSGSASQVPPVNPSLDPALIGAGDICHPKYIANARATAALIKARPNDLVFTLGDNAQDVGAPAEFNNCYDKTWGAFKDRTRPVVGNHEYITAKAAPYYAYFGAAAGPAGQGYYSYDLPNDWHVVVLNAMCHQVGGCGYGSPQESWLRTDLARSPGKHIIAMWHIPEFSSSGPHGSTTGYRDFWQDLYDAHAEIVLNGHQHAYERFARQSPAGKADSMGIREFVVGTGGMSVHKWGPGALNSERRFAGYGVLELTLHSDSYDWQFIATGSSRFSDAGTESCRPVVSPGAWAEAGKARLRLALH